MKHDDQARPAGWYDKLNRIYPPLVMRQGLASMLRLSGLGLLLSGASVLAAPVDSVRVMLPPQTTPSIQNTARILERQITQRCGAKVSLSGESAVTLELAIEPGGGAEGFRIVDGASGTIRVIGHDERGLLYGVGKVLRTSRFEHGVWAAA